jgi:hypothetical protein
VDGRRGSKTGLSPTQKCNLGLRASSAKAGFPGIMAQTPPGSGDDAGSAQIQTF